MNKKPAKKSSAISKHLALSVFISLFLVLAFAVINNNVTGKAILSPTGNTTTNLLLSVVVPFLFFTALFVLILSYIQKNSK
jgi:Na+/H+-dicarboxylate symporter